MSQPFESNSTTDLAGSGDASGGKNLSGEFKTPKKRLPIATCRKTNPKPILKNGTHKFDEMNTPPTVVKTKRIAVKREITPRKRSLTMSDMSPITSNLRSPYKKKPCTTLSTDQSSSSSLHSCDELMTDEQRRELLGRFFARFVYHLWVTRKRRVQEFKEAIGNMEDEIGQLKLQTSFLQNLRENESKRREEAVAEVQQQKRNNDELTYELAQTKQERALYENISKSLEQRVQHLDIDLENIKNECQLVLVENFGLKEQIGRDQVILQNLLNEKKSFIAKVTELQFETKEQQISIENFRQTTMEITNMLNEKQSNLTTETKQKNEVFEKYNYLKHAYKKLDVSLKESCNKEKILKMELIKLEEIISKLKKNSMNLEMDKCNLKTKLTEVELKLDEINSKSWSSVALDVFRPSLNMLHKIVLLMFPAIPKNALTYKTDQKAMKDWEKMNLQTLQRNITR